MGSYENTVGTQFYLDKGDVEVKNLIGFQDQFYQSHYTPNASLWMEAMIDLRFVAGDQSLWSILYGDNNYYQSRRFFFNKMRRHRNMIGGFQRRNRKSTTTVPSHEEDQLCDDWNQTLKWSEGRDGFQEYLSEGFENALDTGGSLLHLYPDYTFDPINGDLFTDNVSIFNYLIDSNWRKMDFSDCNGIWRRRWVSHNSAKSLIPGYSSEIDKIRSTGTKDGKFPLQSELVNMNLSNLLSYDEFNYRSTRSAEMILDPYSGDMMEWEDKPDDPPGLREMFLRQQPWLQEIKRDVPTVKLIITVGGQPVYHGPNLLEIDNYPFVPIVCYHSPDIQAYRWRLQGIIRNMRDAQYLYNMRKVIEMDILQSTANSGWIYKVNRVPDTKAFRQTGQGILIPVKDNDAPLDDSVRRLDPPGLPESILQLSQLLSEDMTEICGTNEELLGSATDDKAGVLSMLRQGAGLTTFQGIFDKLDYSQRLYGSLRLKAIQKWKKGKIKNILGREPHPGFFSPNAIKYTMQVEEGNYSATQRQTELQQLLYFRESVGMPIANKSIMRAAIMTNKKRVEKEMMEEQQAQMQAQNQEIMSKTKTEEAKVIASLAKADYDRAGAQERLANITHMGDESGHKAMTADYDLVRTQIELEGLDLQNLRASAELAGLLQGNQQAQGAQE